ncbi:MAG: hypothetical protein HY860_05440 [Chlamydiales bacterium]|nr:hypothetical protein [Chlamydiales bacterium]
MDPISSSRGKLVPLVRKKEEVLVEVVTFSWSFTVELTTLSGGKKLAPIIIVIDGVHPKRSPTVDYLSINPSIQLKIYQYELETPDSPRFLAELSLYEEKGYGPISIEVQKLVVSLDSSAIWNLSSMSKIALRALATYAEAIHCENISFPNTSTKALFSLFSHGIIPDNPTRLLTITTVRRITGLTSTLTSTRTTSVEKYIRDQIKDPESSGSTKILVSISATLPKALISRLTFAY